MFLKDNLTQPISNRIEFGDVTGTFAESIGGLYESVATPSKIATACTFEARNLVGTDPTFTGVNAVTLAGSAGYIEINSAAGVDLTVDDDDALGSCTIAITFSIDDLDSNQVIFALGNSAYNARVRTTGNLEFNHVATSISVVADTLYRLSISYSSTGVATGGTLTKLSDGTVQTESSNKAAGTHGGTYGFQIGRRTNTNSFDGKVFDFSITNSSKGVNIHLPMQEGGGKKCYDVTGNNGHGIGKGSGPSAGMQRTTLDDVSSHNQAHGFDKELIGNRYGDHWFYNVDRSGSGGGSIVRGDSSIGVTGNTGTGSAIELQLGQVSDGEVYTLTGTIVQTGSGNVFISSASANWDEGSVNISNTPQTATFSKTLTATADAVADLVFISLGGADFTLSDLKLTAATTKIPVITTKTVQVGRFDGVDEYIQGPNITSATHYGACGITAVIDIDSDATGDTRTVCAVGDTGYKISTASGVWYLNGVSTGQVVSSGKQTVSVIFNLFGHATSLTIDGTERWTGTAIATSFNSAGGLQIGATNGASFFKGNMYSWKVSNTGGTSGYEFENGTTGSTNIPDVSGNDASDGTLTNTTIANFWGTRVEDSSGTLVSAEYATGNTIISDVEKAVLNNSEAGLKFISTGTTTITKTKAQLLSHSNGTGNLYVEKSGTLITKLVQFDTAETLSSDEQGVNNDYFS